MNRPPTAALSKTDTTKPGPARSARRGRRTPYPFLFRLLHWALGASLVVLVASGLSLHAVARPDWSLLAGRLPAFFWPGRVHLVHFSAAIVFLPSLLAVTWLYWLRKAPRRITHLTLLGGGLVMALSALVLLNPLGPAAAYSGARLVHAVVGLVVLPVAFLWHTFHGLGRFRGLLVPAFHPWAQPRWRQLIWLLPLPLLTTCLILNGLPVEPAGRELLARRVPDASRPVADLAQLPWGEAPPLRIELANGMGFDGGRTRVTLRALHDGRELFLLAEWLDPTEDRRDMPWEKTADGWRHLVTDELDESRYYEDKFGLAFPTTSDWQFDRAGCAIYCHAGGGRAYGYKGASKIVDVWHWKSTRTDPVGQVDDKYWWQVDFTAKDVGRHGDPKEGGGYKKNFSDDKTRPAFLPDDLATIRQGILPEEHAVEYTPEAAASIPVGTIIPGIVASAATGDRGDVRCQSRHENGRWQLYIRRKLDTGSRYDVQFHPGHSYPFGCAAFDHSSKRHAYEFTVNRLVLEE